MQGVHQQRPHADDLRGGHGAGDRIAQQLRTQALALVLASIASRDNRITGTGSGMLRRTRPGVSARSTAAEASA